jgi:CubicO group peptidase (beta-lactamase class C family)
MTRIDRRTFVAGTAASLLVPAVASAGVPRSRLQAIAGEVAAAARSELRLKGLVVGVLSREGSHVAGAGDTGRGAVPDGSTIFQIASVTKTFTSLALAIAVDRGEVGLDDPVRRHLPGGWEVPARGGRDITLEHLATATSGLPRLPPGIEALPGFDARDPYAHLRLADVQRALASTRLESTPGRRFEYSNFGSGILGIALARARGTSYGALVQRRIAEPLGLRDTVLTRSAGQAARSAVGHDADGNAVPDWRLPALGGAGGLYGTADDMLRYLRAHIRQRPASMAGALSAVRRPRARVDRRTRIGLAWFRQQLPDGTAIAWHNGAVAGHASFVGFAHAAGLGVAVLANTGTPVDEAGVAALTALARGR